VITTLPIFWPLSTYRYASTIYAGAGVGTSTTRTTSGGPYLV
jgi:hypothetical protein